MFAVNALKSAITSAFISTPTTTESQHTPLSRVSSSSSMSSANDSNFINNINQLGTSAPIRPRLDNVVIAISSGALFDFSVDHEIGQTHGPQAYSQYQIENEGDILEKGDAFNLVEKIYAVNEALESQGSDIRFDVVITSKNTPDACVRALHSANHYKLPICRTAFTGGEAPFKYAKAFGAILYLTTNPNDAKAAIEAGMPAAHILPSKKGSQGSQQLRIAFDADAVIFSDESERISMEQGLPEFFDHEQSNAHIPLEKGPLYPLLYQLSQLKKEFSQGNSPIRIAVTTARSAPADERLVKTLRSWGVEIDALHLLGGRDKGPFLEAFEADVFFDDKYKNVEHSAEYVVSGHVNYGVSNESS